MHSIILRLLVRLLILWTIAVTAAAQTEPSSPAAALYDSLRAAPNDTIRMRAFGALQGYYAGRNIDSTLFYLDQAMQMARNIRQPLWLGTYSVIKAFHLQRRQNFSQGLRLCNEALAIAQDPKNEKNAYTSNIAKDPAHFRMRLYISAVHNFGNIYYAAGNREKAIEYYRKEIMLAYEIGDTSFLVNSHRYIGTIYSEMDKPDSALLYAEKALSYAMLYRNSSIPPVLGNIGYVYLKRGALDSAEKYFRQSLGYIGEFSSIADKMSCFLSMVDLFEKLRKPDSVLQYGTAAYAMGKGLNDANAMRISSEKVAAAWRLLGESDSAFIYLSLSKSIGDSLDKDRTQNLIRFQNIGFEEQLKLEKAAKESIRYKNKIRTIGLCAGLAVLSLLAFIFHRNNREKHKANIVLQKTLNDLKTTQAQLIHSEKLASLGELTAGIAHEIQNPLNFVNNFSEVSKELLGEMKEELATGNFQSANEIASDIEQNLDKINYHGKRADAIVKGMLAHSRKSSGQKEPTDMNALCEEYLRLAYHGLKAKDQSLQASFRFEPAKTLPKVNVVPQDIGRVLLNLLNNAFYAVNERCKNGGTDYRPEVVVSTMQEENRVKICVSDNGAGIPKEIMEKIFQPFFTSKPTGEGTGLGLSLSYDIVKAHGGELFAESKVNHGSVFYLSLFL